MVQSLICKVVILGTIGLSATNSPPTSDKSLACYVSVLRNVSTNSGSSGMAKTAAAEPAISKASAAMQVASASTGTNLAATMNETSSSIGMAKVAAGQLVLATPDVDFQSVIQLNIKSFGARCDGSTDDTSAIVSAISAAKSRQIPSVIVPQGRCVIMASHGTAIMLDGTVSLQGIGISSNPLSALVFRTSGSAPEAALAMAASTQVSHTLLRDLAIISSGSNPNSVGIYMGGDPSNQITTSSAIASFQTLENIYVRGFGTNIKYGNNSYGNSYYNVNLESAQRYNMDTQTVGLQTTGITERVFGGLWGAAGIAGLRNYNGNWKFFGTHFEYNCTNIYLAYGSITMFAPHFEQVGETCGPAIESPGGDSRLYINGGEIAYNDNNPAHTYSEFIRLDGGHTNVILENVEMVTNGAHVTYAVNNSRYNRGLLRIEPIVAINIGSLVSSINPGSTPQQMSTSGLDTQGSATFTGNLRINPSGTKPTCSSATEGSIWYLKGSASSNGALQVCQDQRGVFTWIAH